MTTPLHPKEAPIHDRMYQLFREYFYLAERKRRWIIEDDIPWDECRGRPVNPAIADVLETFCAVELYLPDYLGKGIMQVRDSRASAWIMANWGYEESKHSLAMEDWLLRSGARTDEQLADLHSEVFAFEWNLPQDSPCGMVCYAMLQELATWLHYVNLRNLVNKQENPALHKVLTLISVDERAHHDFYRKLVEIHLDADREGTLEQLRRVINTFQMPSVYMLANSSQRVAQIKSLRIFDDDLYYFQVVEPALSKLGLTRADLRRKSRSNSVVLGKAS
jgi:acyl-[acyl-carrier-protein] desaturase